ncbi:transcription factor bHLH85 [Populus alba x Populus x berolinensis]|nr:transcription factor bHLH85 [Populus alba x Populus x berolinensis]
MNMQTRGDFPDGEWDFSRLMFSMEEPDFTPELLGQCSFPRENDEGLQFTIPPAFFPPPEANVSMAGNESLFYSWNALSPNLHFDSQESGNNSNCSSGVFLPSSSHEYYFFNDSNRIQATNDNSMSMDISLMDEKTIGLFMPVVPEIAMGETACMCKRVRRVYSQRKTKGPLQILAMMKKRVMLTRSQSSSSCSSEDDNASNDSDSKVSEAVSSSGKTRASRGAATDPQSL